MLATVLSAGTVLAAETAVRRRINRAPQSNYPHMLTRHIQIRRAFNRGLVGSRLEDHPALVKTAQTASALVAVGAAVLVQVPELRIPVWGRIGAGLLLGGAVANTAERYLRGHVTDYLYLKDSPVPLLRRRIWNIADAAIFNGAVLTAAALMIGGDL